jgi:hypothetical protein
MRDIRLDWHFDDRLPREDRAPLVGARLIVSCEAGDYWPVAGRSERFRCRCGSRETTLSYTVNTAQSEGPMSKDAIRLWT